MIVPDVNVLVYAFHADSPHHRAYADWLNRAIVDEPIGLSDVVLGGVIRIATHPRIFERPAPVAAAVGFAQRLAEAPRAQWLTSGPRVWERFSTIAADDSGIRGNLVPDAYLAALCLANGARLATRDRGFARFTGLRWFDPAR